MINRIFWAVANFLMMCAKVFHVTYNTVNVVAYYFLVPLSWTILLDCGLDLHFLTTLSLIAVWMGIIIGTAGRFQAWCDKVFSLSVEFLLWFNRVKWNYHVASVIICVLVPLLVYAFLIWLNVRTA